MLKSIVIAAVTASISISSAFADRCEVKLRINESFSENRRGFSRIANLGDLLTRIERRTDANLRRAEILGLTLNISSRNPSIYAAWKDVSGLNQNSGGMVYGDRRGDFIMDDVHWSNMLISDARPGSTTQPDHIDINAIGSGVVNSATVYLQATHRICDELMDERNDRANRREEHREEHREERRDDRRGNGQAYGIFNVDLSVDRNMTLKIDQNGVAVVSTDGDYRTGLQNNPNRGSQFSTTGLTGITISPNSYTRVQYTYQIVQDRRNGDYVLVNFTDPSNGAAKGSFSIILQ
ncbi:MAG TPA: hypothetical protein VNJ01_12650 [Bacteriovoracaceae bacterium]|nr:hypothetical protein [Bacteriovoracaceae bacterium]